MGFFRDCEDCERHREKASHVAGILRSLLEQNNSPAYHDSASNFETILENIERLRVVIKKKDEKTFKLECQLETYEGKFGKHFEWCGFKQPGFTDCLKVLGESIHKLEKENEALARDNADMKKFVETKNEQIEELRKTPPSMSIGVWKNRYEAAAKELDELKKKIDKFPGVFGPKKYSAPRCHACDNGVYHFCKHVKDGYYWMRP